MSLKHLHTFDLPDHNATGGFDHAAIHFKTDRLYVAHTVNNSIDIIDCFADRYLSSIPDLAGVAGALVSEEMNLVFTSNRGEDTVGIFSPGEEKRLVKLAVGMRPNGLAFDPLLGLLLVANVGDTNIPGSFTLSIVDIQKLEMVHSIPVPGRTRWAVFHPARNEFLVNIADPACIVGVDAASPDRIIRKIDIPAAGPHGLDLDTSTDRLFCACDSGKLVTMETKTGKVLGSAALSGKPDVIFFNAVKNHLYVAVGDPGVIDVFDTDLMKQTEVVPTGMGAHTLAFDASLNKVYAFLPQDHSAMVFLDE